MDGSACAIGLPLEFIVLALLASADAGTAKLLGNSMSSSMFGSGSGAYS
jgi:hypothetical protein